MRFADIAVNLTDPMFKGNYHGRQKHKPDVDGVVQRAREKGVEKILITGTSLQETKDALVLAKQYDLQCTAGVHPTSTSEMAKHPQGPSGYIRELCDVIDQDLGEGGSKRIISIGEIGLDYDRLHHSPRETQLAHLAELLLLSKHYRLPLFLHCRTSESQVDLIRILKEIGWSTEWGGGVVHSFTGSAEEAKEFVDMGLYIGINGCSLKTPESLEMVKATPLSHLLLETDAPWCGCTSTSAGFPFLPPADSPLNIQKMGRPDRQKEGLGVKGRMEPAELGVIAHVVAQVKGIDVEELAREVWDNTMRLFYPHEIQS
ncbi:hypothetical protein IAR50_004697 [Cryptococcus sp. DSM 104548]